MYKELENIFSSYFLHSNDYYSIFLYPVKIICIICWNMSEKETIKIWNYFNREFEWSSYNACNFLSFSVPEIVENWNNSGRLQLYSALVNQRSTNREHYYYLKSLLILGFLRSTKSIPRVGRIFFLAWFKHRY